MEHYLCTGSVRSTDAVSRQTKPLSYVASKCVLKHLEANTRFLLVSHCPRLRNQHMTVPLKIEFLKFEFCEIQINNYEHSFHWNFHNTCIRYMVRFENRTYHLSNVPGSVEPAEKFMKNFILKGHTPLVKQLQITWRGLTVLEPKYIAKNMKIYKRSKMRITVENFRSIVDPKSFPFENLSFIIYDPEDNIFERDWSKITNFLRIELYYPIGYRFLQGHKLCNIRNNNVQVYLKYNFIFTESLAELAQNWMNTNREIGTKYTFQFGVISTDYLRKLALDITALTGFSPRNDKDQLWFSFKMGNEKELMIYREYGPNEKPTCKDITIDWTLAMEIL